MSDTHLHHSDDLLTPHASLQCTPHAKLPIWGRLVAGWANQIRVGSISIQFPNGYVHHVEGHAPGPNAILIIRSTKFAWQMMSGGSLGFARAYMDELCDSPDLSALLDLGIANEQHISSLLSMSVLTRAIANLRHRARANTKAGSKRNIAFHYDLGNAFYGHWLDKTMTYSSALYSSSDQSLEAAQIAKYDRIIQRLNISAQDKVLEIGCGWGGFAEYAAKTTRCHIVALTLSREQAAYAVKRITHAGLQDNVEIRIEDYRNCKGCFDKIVSIEMFEAVGEENWPIYFGTVNSLLTSAGDALLQVITIDDSRLESYRANADFIQTYIFPGGMLPSPQALIKVADRSCLRLIDQHMFGLDYARTLGEWDNEFVAKWPMISPLGFDNRFKRMWRYYFHYCAAGFRAKRIDLGQFHFRKIENLP